MSDLIVLSVDLGKTSGFAIWDKSTQQISLFEKKIMEKEQGQLFNNFSIFLENLFKKDKITLVFFENIMRHQGTYAAHMYGALKAILLMTCTKLKITCIGIGVTTIRKSITGNGRASKADVEQTLKAQGFTVNLKLHNQMDALAVLLCAQKKYKEFF